MLHTSGLNIGTQVQNYSDQISLILLNEIKLCAILFLVVGLLTIKT